MNNEKSSQAKQGKQNGRKILKAIQKN